MITPEKKRNLNRLDQRASRYGLGTEIDQAEKVKAVTYDFSVFGGANATDITLQADFFGENAIVTKIVAHESATLTSAGLATLTVKAGATALTAAKAFDTGFTGIDDLGLAGGVGGIAVGANDDLVLDIGTADLTAGVVRFYVYMLPQRDI